MPFSPSGTGQLICAYAKIRCSHDVAHIEIDIQSLTYLKLDFTIAQLILVSILVSNWLKFEKILAIPVWVFSKLFINMAYRCKTTTLNNDYFVISVSCRCLHRER